MNGYIVRVPVGQLCSYCHEPMMDCRVEGGCTKPLRTKNELLRLALTEYVTGCHACLGTGTTPGVLGQPGTYGRPCLECVLARAALSD